MSEAKMVLSGFDDLWHRQWVTGVKELGGAVRGLPHLLSDCHTLSADIAQLESWAVVFTTPSALPDLVRSNVTHHLIGLTRDLNKARSEWKNEQYYAFGTTLGEMLVIATQPLTMSF